MWGNQFRIEFKVDYHHEVFGSGKTTGTLYLWFSPTWNGEAKVYKIHTPSHFNMDQGWRINVNKVEAYLNALCKENTIETAGLDGNVFVNNVLRQAEKMYRVQEGTYELNKVERIDGGIKVFIYTDKSPFNPQWNDSTGKYPKGRGELWLTFKYDDAQLAKGFVQVSEIKQGYWYWEYRRDTGKKIRPSQERNARPRAGKKGTAPVVTKTTRAVPLTFMGSRQVGKADARIS
jgi:hypothetical protein